ncbi:hypothetical protein MMC32_006743 [Xylographa parallela]|nr:hypothetical protein [Xylographa parallela]
MSSSDAVRGPAHSARRTAATSGTRPRVPSSRVDELYPDSGGEVHPSDSASNAPQRRNASGSHKAGSSQRLFRDRRVERTNITINDSVQIRTRGPTKPSAGDGPSEWLPLPRDNVEATRRETDQISTNAERKVLPPWAPSASIIAHTTAPLAGRISFPTLSSLLPEAMEPPPLKQLSPDAQESAILDDLLFAFMGYEGQYVRFSSSYDPTAEKERLAGPEFEILFGLDPSLQDLSTTMLKMATHYIAVGAFVEVQSREEFGMVNHALCASIRKLLKEYLVLIAQMEHQLATNASFTLHVLHLHTLPTSHMLSQLYTLAQEMLRKNSLLEEDLDSFDDFDDVDNILEQLREGGELAPGGMSKKICKGGNVLRLLTERLSFMSGDPAARDLLQGLLRDSSKPYMAMLNEWLHHGGIKDPHSEFLIKEQKSIRRDRLEEDYTDEYWEKRYTIRENDVPPQLEGVKDKVLLAGKYLNVVRECGGVDISTEVRDVPKSFDDPQFLHNVNAAYAHANSSLLNLLLTTHALPARLRSMKHYFFLDRSDFFSYFLYLSNSELKKQVKEVNVGKLQSLLDLVLRQPGSVAAQDPFKEDVKIHMNDQYLTKFLMGVVSVRGFDQDGNDESHRMLVAPSVTEDDNKMTGFEALEFKYTVPFPLSLVISSKTVVRYQILFRYLLSMRHLEGVLVSSWEDHNKVMTWTHRSGNHKLEMWKRRAWTLRARMLNFVQQFTYYCTSEVIEPNWQNLMAKVNGNRNDGSAATGEQQVNRTVDELMEDHVDFLDTCLKECMLMNSKLLRIHAKLMSCCTFFAANTSSFSRTLCSADATLAGSAGALAYLATRYPSSRYPIPDHLKTFDPDGLNKMTELLDKYEENFNRHLGLLLDALDYYAATETVALSRLCAQLSMASDKGGGEDGRQHGF